ncbi:MAG: SIS domain-containing protein [Fuerstiella sp.]
MLGLKLNLEEYLDDARRILSELNRNSVQELTNDLYHAWQQGRVVFVCGNGGAGSTANHFAEDLLKSTLDPGEFENDDARRMKVISLSQNTPSILAWANDEGFEKIFVEQLKNFARPGDVLLAMSGSGNSPNVLKAVDWANAHELMTWGLTGRTGGELAELAERTVQVPSDDMGMIQSVHLLIFHCMLDDLHGRVNGKGRHAQRNELRSSRVASVEKSR